MQVAGIWCSFHCQTAHCSVPPVLLNINKRLSDSSTSSEMNLNKKLDNTTVQQYIQSINAMHGEKDNRPRHLIKLDSWQFDVCLSVLNGLTGDKSSRTTYSQNTRKNIGRSKSLLTKSVNDFTKNIQQSNYETANETSVYKNGKIENNGWIDESTKNDQIDHNLKTVNKNCVNRRSEMDIFDIDNRPLVNHKFNDNVMHNLGAQSDSSYTDRSPQNSNKTIKDKVYNDEKNCLHSMRFRPFVQNHCSEKEKYFTSQMDIKKITRILNLNENQIYDMTDKIEKIESALKFVFIIDEKTLYCITCGINFENTPQAHCEHFCDRNHYEFLQKMEKNDEMKEPKCGQISGLDLASQYMDIMSKSTICCLVCVLEIENLDSLLTRHMETKSHKEKWQKMLEAVRLNFQSIKTLIECNWYKVEKYRCADCKENFKDEIDFVDHLERYENENFFGKRLNHEDGRMYEFCATCSLLSYGFPSSHANHCYSPTHKMLLRNEFHLSNELPEEAKNILANLDDYVDHMIDRRRSLFKVVERVVKHNYPLIKVRIFRSAITAFNSMNNEVDVFLDCREMWHERTPSQEQVSYLMSSIHEILRKDSQSWKVEKFQNVRDLLTINAYHIATEFSFGIHYESDLEDENTELIKFFNNIFPLHRKMIVFLQKWLDFCKLSGPEHISNYTLYWHVIFYLQKESVLPSIAWLIAMKEANIDPIAGWHISDSYLSRIKNKFSIKESLIDFFSFYANFDYRQEVLCPLVGKSVKKQDFIHFRNLPAEMELYVSHVKKYGDMGILRIDSVMCLQDPFDLRQNLTQRVSKADVNLFRVCCLKSSRLLSSL